MSALKYLTCIFCLTIHISIKSQDQSILIFDPNDVSTSFQSTLSQLTDDSVFIADTLDNSIFNYDAAFLFFVSPAVLTESVVNNLIDYTSEGKSLYIFNGPVIDSTTSPFWNHIGLDEMYYLLVSSLVDSVTGVDTTFTNGVVIDTSFMSWSVPAPMGTISPILIGQSAGLDVNAVYVSTVDTLNVILDLYNLIDDYGFLQRVLEHFGLIPLTQNVQIQFLPSVDTAFVGGGCTTPELICRNLISTNYRDSISIEPGFNTIFYYFDSTGYQILLDNYYFIVIDSLDEYDYEVWFHPKSYPPFEPTLIAFDSFFYSDQNDFDLQLVVKENGNRIDSLSQPFQADFGLNVDDSLNAYLPNNFKLFQNYPNPFNPSTKIKYEIPFVETHSEASLQITLKVYDVLGNEVAILVNEQKPAGDYIVAFNGTNLSSGIYFYQLKAGNFVETKKMILMK